MLNKEIQRELVKSFTDGFVPMDTRKVWEWAKDNVNLPGSYAITGKFNINVSPYLKKPMEDLTNNSIRQINFACSTQTFKSGVNEIYVPYVILQNPGNMLRIHQNDVAANTCMETRILPILANNEATRLLMDGVTFNKKEGLLNLPNGMFVKSCGTSINNLQSLSIKYLVLEEVCFYENENVIEEAFARTSYYEKVKKIIIASQPDIEDSPLHKQYMKGNVYEWGWRCPNPECNMLQLYEFNGERNGKHFGLVWLPNNASGSLTYDERTNDTRLVCQHCFHEVMDTDENHITLVANGDYIQTHKGEETISSYTWPAYVNKDKSFKLVAMEYLTAKTTWDNERINEKMKVWKNKTLGKFWGIGEIISTPKLLQDLYNPSEKWPEETHRFLTIDVQQDCNYWLVTAWSNKVAEARLIDWGVCVGFDEINEIKRKYNVHPLCVAIDSGNDTKPIYKESIQRGELYTDKQGKKHYAVWTCLKGDGGKLNARVVYKHKDGIDRYYAPETYQDCQWESSSKYRTLRARLVLWSNYSIKTILTNMRDGKIPFKFKYNERATETFNKQMYSEELNPKSGRYEKIHADNHIWDLMCMSLVMSLMSKCFVPAASSVTPATIPQETTIKT